MMRRIVAIALAVFGSVCSSPAGLRADSIQAVPSPSSCPTRPAAPPTRTRAQVANSLSNKLKQNFIVENVSGGGTIIATDRVVNAAPDGYTLLLHNLQISANVTLYKNLPFDTEKDLDAGHIHQQQPAGAGRAQDARQTTLHRAARPDEDQTLNAAMPGFGATGHLATALLAQEAKVQIDLIPYRGAAPAMQDILGDHVDLFFATPQSVVPQVTAGQMKAYGITAKEKSPKLPNAESLVDAFGPKFEIHFWQALFAPGGTPEAVINKLNAAVQEVVVRSGHHQDLGGRRASRPIPKSNDRWRRPTHDEERDCALGRGRPRQQYSQSIRLASITSTQPCGLTAPAAAPARASPTYRPSRCSGCRSGSGGSRLPRA